ncbi:MAG: hypothetical protein EHM55_05800 [Acidobacteria bacterium]|nr:MAG: hypothetical protein EHM55_05800 [Acidobacteriota bacterium]
MQNRPACVLAGALLLSGAWLLPSYLLTAKVLGWLLYGYILLLPFVLPLRAALVASLALLCTGVMLTAVNYIKIVLTRFPLTLLDVEIFLDNPGGLLSALEVPPWLGVVAIAAFLMIGLVVFYALVRVSAGWPRPITVTSKSRFLSIGVAVLVIFGFLDFVGRFNQRIPLLTANDDSLWTSGGVIRLSRDLGAIGFLVYSLHLERSVIDYIHASSDTPPSDAAIQTAVASHVTLPPSRSDAPDIMLVFAESTFDPNQIFRLSAPVKNTLFEPNSHTRLLTPIRVNAVGGGSWISEFESLVGIDSRLFGYAGYYTHLSLAPYIRKSIVTHLRDRGYRTTAFYSAGGDFYRARRAFASYGFEEFFDEQDLDLPKGWAATDEQTAAAVTTRLNPSGSSPVFAFVSLAENHAPHRCQHYADGRKFVATFSANANFDLTCTLNEYILKTYSTERAVKRLLTFLEKRASATGRAFVLLVFGDHQPHTFTRTGGETADFQPFRTQFDERTTFLHLMSSVNGVVADWSGAHPPLTVIPTLLSAFVATSMEDIYLAQNFLQLEVCGSDLFARRRIAGFWGGTSLPVGEKERCSILDELVAGYRKAGVFTFH